MGSTRPEMAFSSVDLPAPLVPSRAMISPSSHLEVDAEQHLHLVVGHVDAAAHEEGVAWVRPGAAPPLVRAVLSAEQLHRRPCRARASRPPRAPADAGSGSGVGRPCAGARARPRLPAAAPGCTPGRSPSGRWPRRSSPTPPRGAPRRRPRRPAPLLPAPPGGRPPATARGCRAGGPPSAGSGHASGSRPRPTRPGRSTC